MKQELKPCPMCAGNAILLHQQPRVWVECHKCGVKTRTLRDVDDNEVILLWNTRPDHSGESAEMVKLKAQVKELSSALTWANTQVIKEHFGDTISESQMRYEIAKDCVSATLSRTHIVGGEIKDVVGYSIRVADELINQLQQQSDEK